MRWITKVKYLIITLCFVAINGFAQKHLNTITYVYSSAQGANNGTSWNNAYTDLQVALNDPQATEIWVAQGIYAPTTKISSETSGFFIDGFGASGKVLGGFNGSETAANQRNIELNLTLLEQNNTLKTTDNVILYSTSKSNDILFDGFTISTSVANDQTNTLTVNLHLINCKIGSLLVNNSAEFIPQKLYSDELKSATEINALPLDDENKELSLNDEFSISLNDGAQKISILSAVPSTIEIMNYLGNVVRRIPLTESPTNIDVSTLPKGLYIIKVTNAKIGIKTARVMLQ